MTRWAFAMATTLAAAGLAPAAVTTKVVEYEFELIPNNSKGN